MTLKTKFLNLIDFEKVDTLLEGFNQSTGFVTAILDLDGNVLSKSGWRQVCTEFHRINSKSSKRCTISDTILAGQLAADEKYHFYKCLNGLVDVAVPIVIKGEHIANLFSGQFFFEKPDILFFKEQAKKFGFDEENYLIALEKVPVIPEEKVKVAMEFLLNMTLLISEMTFQKLEQIELNEELRTSEERFRAYINQAVEALFVHNFSGQITDVNPQACRTLGYSREELLNMSVFDLELDFDLPRAQEAWSKIQPNKPFILLGHQRRKDGSIFPVEVQFGCFDLGEKRYYMGLARDITERKQAENALRESEERYRFMFDNNPQPNLIYDLETLSILEINEAVINHYGYSKEEFLSMTLKDISMAEDIPALLKAVKLANKPYNIAGEWRHKKKNGELVYAEIMSHSVLFNGREARHVLAHIITDRKLAEEALKQANYELEKLHNNLEEAVYSVDMIHNKMISVSIAHQTVFGHSPSEFFNNPQLWFEIILPEDKPLVDSHLAILATGKNICFEYRISHPNGEIHWIEDKISPTLDKNGILTRIDGVSYDVTNRKQVETELIESEINFRRSISESPMGIRIVSVDGDTVYANKAFLDIYEFNSLEEFKNTPAKNRYTPESYIQHQERKKSRDEGLEVLDYEINIICKTEGIRHVKVSRKEILWNGVKHFLVVNINITEQRKAENELRKLSRAVEQSPDGICITNPEGIIEYVNPITTELTGYTQEEMLGHESSIFSSGEKPKEEYAQLWETIKSGNVWSGELHNKKKNGELYWESTTISPIFDNQEKITHFLAIKIDISERKRAETALLNSEEQLRKFASHLQNVREEEKVAIAREIHDDLGQILVALKIDMGLLKKDAIKMNTFGGSDDTLDKFDNIVSMIDKTIKTARRIMNGLRPELLEMHGFMGATKEYLHEFEDRHQISCEFLCVIPDVELTSQQALTLFRILQEALNNIVKHAKARLVKIQIQKEIDTLIMEISDDGIGFDKSNSGRQDSYGMIGMKERVVLLEGKLDITSEVGKGTCIRVEIPFIFK